MKVGVALGAGAVAAAAAAAYWTAWYEPRRLVVTERTLRLPDWPEPLDGLRVGLMSDLHAGLGHTNPARVREAVALLNDQRPDLICLLGDYLDSTHYGRGRADPLEIAAELAQLHAPLGRFAVLGNHDWRAAGSSMGDALRAVGLPVLENEACQVDALWVAGLADMRTRLPDIPKALEDVPEDAPVLLLAHDPDLFPMVPPRVALTLAGHTHGAQVDVPVVRLFFIPSGHGVRYLGGHVEEEGRQLFVSTGVGTAGLPLRFRRPPEVVILTLRS
jgi:predicted MPP superfamily phosphohydrolase